MGKQGPCCHCGVTSTPLWRNGPPDKPVLCNACGSRWRTKGSLTHYTPLHAREATDSEELKVTKLKGLSFKPKERKLPKKQQTCSIPENEPYSDQNFRKIVEADTSNRSSSGSVTSYAESCVHHVSIDASDLTGSSQSNAWDSLVPSKKRTCLSRPNPSPVEKLTKDLHSIMDKQLSSGSSEDDLLYQSENPMDSFETGYGSILIWHPSLKLEEESEASSVPVDNKPHVSRSASYRVNSENKGTIYVNAPNENLKKPVAQMAQNNAKRDELREKTQILRDADLPLLSVDLKEKELKQRGGNEPESVLKFDTNSNFMSVKRPHDGENHTQPDHKDTMRCPKRTASKSGCPNVHSSRATSNNAESECINGNDYINGSRSSIFMSVERPAPDDSSDQDLLVDVPHIAFFPEAELLRHPPEQKPITNISTSDCRVSDGGGSFSNNHHMRR